jgi:hypothetical protein
MVLMGIREPGSAAGEPSQAAGKLRSEPGEVVSSKPVDGDHHDECGPLLGSGLGDGGLPAKCERGERKKATRHAPI